MRRLVLPLAGLLVLPSILAAGCGIWNAPAAWQEHLGLEILLRILLFLESSSLHSALVGEGLVGPLEVGLLLGFVALVVGTAPLWEPRLPRPLLRGVDILECLPVLVGGITCAAVVAVAAAMDRPLFWGGLCLGVASAASFARPESEADDRSWRAAPNRLRRLGVAVFATAAGYYGVTSLWEGPTYHNPVFRLRSLWLDGPGGSAFSAGLCWGALALVLGGLLLWRAARITRPSHRLLLVAASCLGLAGVFLSWMEASSPARGLAGLISGLGILVLAAGLAGLDSALRTARPRGLLALDPRRVLACALPLVLWSAFCVVRGLTLSMWLPPGEPVAGVEKIGEADCVFSLATAADDSVFYTDRCATQLGHIAAGQLTTWDLEASGGDRVEELGGPDSSGTLWAAIQAYAIDSQLVMLAVEGAAGPRTVPAAALGQDRAQAVGLVDAQGQQLYQSEADGLRPERPAHLSLEGCWLASWIPLPRTAGDSVLLGCENRTGGLLFDPASRTIISQVDVGSRLESGAFSPTADRLFGLSLWSDPYLHAFDWPSGEERDRRTIGPFNWEVLAVPATEGYRLWVPRFIEGTMLILDPETLDTEAQVSLSFGIRAAHYEPKHHRVWAAASYSGELWSIEASPPYRASVLPTCGQTRDLSSDSQGRVVASTDCGIFRFDAATLFPAGAQ